MFSYVFIVWEGRSGGIQNYRSDGHCAKGHHPSTVPAVQIMLESTSLCVYFFLCICMCCFVGAWDWRLTLSEWRLLVLADNIIRIIEDDVLADLSRPKPPHPTPPSKCCFPLQFFGSLPICVYSGKNGHAHRESVTQWDLILRQSGRMSFSEQQRTDSPIHSRRKEA